MTEGISGTAYELYQQPDPLRDEPEEHSWDREIDRLRAQDEGEHPSRRPPGTIAEQSPIAHASHLAYLARAGRVYSAAERRQENEERVEELMTDFEGRLAKGETDGNRP